MKRLLSFIVLYTSMVSALFGQDCTGYHQFECEYADYTFFYSRQSTSMLLKQGQSGQVNMVAYGGEEYYIAVCAHKKFGDIQFRIIEDGEAGTIVYDNSVDDNASSVKFKNNVTRNLIIEVTVPEASKQSNERRCVGVIIQFKKE